MTHTRLSVNLNKIALIRNARGSNLPNLSRVARDCEFFGAEGITVHPRPDQRHVRYDDIPVLKGLVKTEFNVEGNPTPDFLDLVCKYAPHQVTLVPDAPGALTSDAGWDTIKHEAFLKEVIQRLQSHGIRVSIFVDPVINMLEGAKNVGTDRIELYTGPYAEHFHDDREKAVAPYAMAGKLAGELQLGLNAGHDLNLDNLAFFKERVPNLLEVSIGHALTCDALYYGLKNTIGMYLNCLKTDHLSD
ncbi:MAG: pyridoxine 5'-phosphate synthase [Bacteroidota bacterium]